MHADQATGEAEETTLVDEPIGDRGPLDALVVVAAAGLALGAALAFRRIFRFG
jgi:hypothetical protein